MAKTITVKGLWAIGWPPQMPSRHVFTLGVLEYWKERADGRVQISINGAGHVFIVHDETLDEFTARYEEAEGMSDKIIYSGNSGGMTHPYTMEWNRAKGLQQAMSLKPCWWMRYNGPEDDAKLLDFVKPWGMRKLDNYPKPGEYVVQYSETTFEVVWENDFKSRFQAIEPK